MCGVFLCLCLQIKPYPLRWTVVSECVVLVQCCKGIWQIAPLPPLPLSPLPCVLSADFISASLCLFLSTDLCKGAHDGCLLVILKVPYCANLNLPIMCFWPVSECPRNKQTKKQLHFIPLRCFWVFTRMHECDATKKTDDSTRLVKTPQLENFA